MNPGQYDGDDDGIGDLCDTCLPANTDMDCDWVLDGDDNCVAVYNPPQADPDLDGAGDACDPCPLDPDDDIDGDGLCANVDPCPPEAEPRPIRTSTGFAICSISARRIPRTPTTTATVCATTRTRARSILSTTRMGTGSAATWTPATT